MRCDVLFAESGGDREHSISVQTTVKDVSRLCRISAAGNVRDAVVRLLCLEWV